MIKIDAIIRSKKRTITLQIKPDGTLVARIPLRLDISQVYKFAAQKKKWIISKQSEMRNRFEARQQRIREYHENDEKKILFLGERIFCDIPQEKLLAWYKREALKHMSARVEFYCKKFSLNYARVKINSAKTRWGSCSARGNINFSWRLIMAPRPVVDYVIAHEVAHLKHKNHSARFWKFVGEIMPDYAQQRQWLKDNGFLLDIEK